MGGSGDWGMPCSNASPAGSTGHPSMMRPAMEYNSSKNMMSGPMVNRSNSVPGSRSMLQQQLMDMGKRNAVFLSKGGDRDHSGSPVMEGEEIRFPLLSVCLLLTLNLTTSSKNE